MTPATEMAVSRAAEPPDLGSCGFLIADGEQRGRRGVIDARAHRPAASCSSPARACSASAVRRA
ncbi:hypothetical protein, partial [Rothia kristinae]|uniref:hypothetical protein n=1 Tax=Rothia kristinae TaxID=37923 RepID=UPI001A96D0CC